MSLCPTEVFIGYGNVLTFEPYSDIVAAEKMDLSGVTLIEVCVGGVGADSDDEPIAIAWDQNADDDWVILLKLGLLPGLTEGEQSLRIVVFDADYPNGVVLTHDYQVDVIGPC